jgi:hypothetical protein
LIFKNKEAKQKALGMIIAKEMDRLRKLNLAHA